MAKSTKKIYEQVNDAIMNSGLEDTVTYNGTTHTVVVTDETELRTYHGIELDTNKLALLVKKDLFTSLSRGSQILYDGKNYEVKTKVSDFFGTYVVGLVEGDPIVEEE